MEIINEVQKYHDATQVIKDAILQSQYQAAKMASSNFATLKWRNPMQISSKPFSA